MEIKKYSSEYRKEKEPRCILGPSGDNMRTRRASLLNV